jgi:hypothetical protein
MPKLMPFESANSMVPLVAVCVPAAMPAMSMSLALNDAVRVDPESPKLTPFELEKTRFERLLLVVPPEMLTFVSSVPPLVGIHTLNVPAAGVAWRASSPFEFENPIPTVLAVEEPTWKDAP